MNDPHKRASIGARRSPETEAAVLQAATELIAEVGYGALTMEAVAKRAHAGKATLYRWWPSKAHLVLALVSRAKTDMDFVSTGTLPGDLAAYMTQLLSLWCGSADQAPMGALVRVLYAEAADNPAFGALIAEERRLRWIQLDDILDAARQRGELAPRLTAPRAKAMAMALPIYLLMTDQLPKAEDITPMIDDILAGLKA